MRTMILATAIAVTAVIAYAQSTVVKPAAPQATAATADPIKWSKTTHDFGTVDIPSCSLVDPLDALAK